MVDHGIGSGLYAEGIVNRSILFGAHATDPLAAFQACITTGILSLPGPPPTYPVVRDTGMRNFSS